MRPMSDGAAGRAAATLRAVERRAWSIVAVVIIVSLILLGSGREGASPVASAQVQDGETTERPSGDDGRGSGVAEERSGGRSGGGGQSGDDVDGTATDGDADDGTDVATGEGTGEDVPTSEPDGSADPDPGGTGSGDADVGGDTPSQTDGADGDTGGGAPQPGPGAGGGTGGDTAQSPTGGAGGSQPPVHVARPGGPEEPLTHGGTIGDVDDDRGTRGETSRSPGPPGSAETGTVGEMGGGREAASGWMLADRLVPARLADIGEPAPGGSPPGGPTVDDATGGSVTSAAGGDTDEDASEPARRQSGGEQLDSPDEAGSDLSTARASAPPAEGGSKTLWLVIAGLLTVLVIAGVGADAARHAAGGHGRRDRGAYRR